ncbi:SWIM zinc finger family protein [Stagonosporopsis vannaccii]|nr:SWIM zinc finger family protein [Stagonosporopsis vannaccii]
MSADQFSQLSLEESMVTTRAGAAKASRIGAPPQQLDQDSPLRSLGPDSPVSPTPSLVISTNNLSYNVSVFDTNQRRRAKRGLQDSAIRMKYCTTIVDDEDSSIQSQYFYINDDVEVAMGGKLSRPRCSCGANENGVACKHIYWIGDHVVSTVPDAVKEQPLQLSTDGSTFQHIRPAEILERRGLQGVAGDLDWVYEDEDVFEDEDDIKETVISMLSVFEPQEALPGEFQCPESPLTSERSKKYQKLAELFTEYAAQDPGLFLQMRDIIDPSFQGRVFFEKIENRITQVFNALDEWITDGPADASVDAQRFDLATTAKKLRGLVTAIHNFVEQQDEDDHDFKEIAIRAAAALVRILDLVTDRNVDAYENITWGMRPGSPSDNNLYYALIGNPAVGALFVLNALHSLPHEDVIRSQWATLQGIESKLVQHDAPADYLSAFHQVVHDSRKRAASETCEGQVKRTAS